MQHIGIGTFGNHPEAPTEWLKRYALLFDKIAIIDLEASKRAYISVARAVHGCSDPEGTLSDIEYLAASDFLTQADAVQKKTKSIPKEAALRRSNLPQKKGKRLTKRSSGFSCKGRQSMLDKRP
jgi:hypothetical protein